MRDQLDEEDRGTAWVPSFRPPGPTGTATLAAAAGTPVHDQTMDDLSSPPYDDVDGPGMDSDRPEVPRLGRDTRTATSGTSDPGQRVSPKDVAALAATLVAALAVAASAFVRWRTRGRARLRRPTGTEADAIGAPLGRIAARHIPLPALVPDLRDAILTAVAVSDYLDAGDLVEYQGADSGMPANLNQEPTP